MVFKDLTGQRFGKLTVIKRGEDAVSKSGRHRTRWLCKCDCGKEVLCYADNLTRGASASCGCVRNAKAAQRVRTHGESKTHLYGVWSAMKARCFNPHVTHYDQYGGRGISICDAWAHSYEAFRDWALATGYKQGLSIDRIDTQGDYEPSNCRWVDATAQANNRRSNILVTHQGQTHNITEWAQILGINSKTVFSRIYSGLTPEKALFGTNY